MSRFSCVARLGFLRLDVFYIDFPLTTQNPLTIKITNSQNLSERPLSHRASQTQPPGRVQRNTKRKVMFYSLVFFPRLTKSVPSSCHTSVSAVIFSALCKAFGLN